MNDKQITIAEFVESAGIRMTARRVENNPNMAPDRYITRHFRCTFTSTKTRGRMAVSFSQGSLHTADPTAADVLDCLANEASSAEQAEDFADFCAEFDYDTDSREAERTFRACRSVAKRLRRFLGDSACETLFYGCERL